NTSIAPAGASRCRGKAEEIRRSRRLNARRIQIFNILAGILLLTRPGLAADSLEEEFLRRANVGKSDQKARMLKLAEVDARHQEIILAYKQQSSWFTWDEVITVVRCLAIAGRLAEAEEAASRLTQSHPDKSNVWLWLGDIQLLQDRL